MATVREYYKEIACFRKVPLWELLWGYVRYVFGWRPATMTEYAEELLPRVMREAAFQQDFLFPMPKRPPVQNNLIKIVDDTEVGRLYIYDMPEPSRKLNVTFRLQPIRIVGSDDE